MKFSHLLVTTAILLVIAAVFGAAAFALNMFTGPIIEANNAGAANDRLNAVMPGGNNYEDITATLQGVPASVVKVNKETSGLGFVIEAQATSQYTGSTPMDIVLGVDATGKICGLELAAHSESLIFGADYPSTYIGKDSALADVGLYAGSTFSSTAFKTAVEEAMGVLIANNLIVAGVKSDAQILEELIPTVAAGYVKPAEIEASGNIQKALKAENDAGFAYIMTEGEATYLVLVNATGVAKVYDVEANDVTADKAALADEAKAHASANQKSYTDALITKAERMMEGATEITPLELDTYNTVVAAVSLKVGDATYYAFYSRSYGFHQMDVYFVVDENGAIAKIDAKQFIFEEEYFMNFGGMDPAAYKAGFVGVTADTYNGDIATIATATMTSNAMKQSTEDAFACFNSIKGGEQ